jgi:DNA-binding ferritin-like protein
MLRDTLLRYVGFAKAITMWMHAAHHLTKGPSFIANHELLFGRIYQTLADDFDTAVEKLVYLMDDEIFACPLAISNIASTILDRYDSPANMSEKSIEMISLTILVDHMKGIEIVRDLLEKQGQLTLGVDDFLGGASNQYESYAYMIKQQSKER